MAANKESIHTGGYFVDGQDKKYIAYLEKQKEQKPLMYDGEIEDRKRDIVAAIRKYYPADYAEYLTSFLKGLSPEDNSEDEYGQKMLGIAYKLMYEHIPENLRTQEFWDSLKFMREYTGKVAIIHSYEKPAEQLSGIFTSYDMAKTFTEGQNYVIAHPEKFGLCKPAEWSEEDEIRLKEALEVLDESIKYLPLQHGFIKDVMYVKDWLESLRPQPSSQPNINHTMWHNASEEKPTKLPIIHIWYHGNRVNAVTHEDTCLQAELDDINFQPDDKWAYVEDLLNAQPHWKPSEEQIDALNSIILNGSFTYVGQVQDLISLKDDLKKLL